MREQSPPSVRLILHSDQSHERTGEIDAQLIRSLSGKRNPRLVYVPSVADPRHKYFAEKARYYEKIGITNCEYFDPLEEKDPARVDEIFQCDVIHLAGGEVCRFMERLVSSGTDQRLRNFAARGGVLVGVSAGAMLLGRTFAGAGLFGERGPTDGLGLFDFEIIPHVAEHFPRMDLLQVFANKTKKTLYALNDGDVVVVSGRKIRTFGAPMKLEPQAVK
ncbi:MAG: hypothetical protein RL189_3060 [Pseudomonadota bacterium]